MDDDLRQLGHLLWRCREHLEQIEFLLDVQHLLVAGGRDRWLARIVDQLDAAGRDLAAADGQWADLATRIGTQLGLGERATLRQLAERAPDPWAGLLTDHTAWFASQARRVAEAATRAQGSTADGLAGVRELLRDLRGAAGDGYDHGGRAVSHTGAGSLFFDDRA